MDKLEYWSNAALGKYQILRYPAFQPEIGMISK